MIRWSMFAAMAVLSASAAVSMGACTTAPEGDEGKPEAALAAGEDTAEASEALDDPAHVCRHSCSQEYDACMDIWTDLRRCTKRFVRCLDRCRDVVIVPPIVAPSPPIGAPPGVASPVLPPAM